MGGYQAGSGSNGIVNGVQKEPRWKFWRSKLWSTNKKRTQVVPEKQKQRQSVLSTPVFSKPPAGVAIWAKPAESGLSDFPERYGTLNCCICEKEVSNGKPYRGRCSSDGRVKAVKNVSLPKSVSKEIEIEGTCLDRYFLTDEMVLKPIVGLAAATEPSYKVLICSSCHDDCKKKRRASA